MFADFILTNETYVFLGGYNTYYKPNNFSEGLRTQSLKGLLRYWLRTYLAGAGMSINEINERTCELFGGRINDKFFASKVQIKSYMIFDKPFTFYRKDFPRINLLTLKKDKREVDGTQVLKARVSLNERIGVNLSKEDKELSVGVLLTSLLLSGIGKMSRRGFGTFRIDVQEDSTKLFYDKITTTFGANSTDKDRKVSITEIIEKTRGSIKEEKPISDIPPIHAINKEYFKLIYISMTKEPENVVKDLQDFTLRSRRAKVLFGNFKKDDEITRCHLAWFLGLPRSQRAKGYIITKDIQRRASPLFFSVHKNFTLVSLFLSKDWPGELEWCDHKGKKQLKIGVNEIKEAYKVILKSLIDYLDKLNYKWEVIYGDS